MEIICKYSLLLQKFLEDVVEYTINLYSDKIKIESLKCIELVNRNELEIETDGRTIDKGTKIILTSRLYEKLPFLEINKLQDNDNFHMIVNTLFHEMGHVTDWKIMPNLYNCIKDDTPARNLLTSLFWVEFIAEKRSCEVDNVGCDEFCQDFVSREWKAYNFSYDADDMNENNFFYLNKLIPYFLAKITTSDEGKKYLDKIVNSLLKEYILELQEECTKLEKEMPFDDLNKLNDLFEIMDIFYRKFVRKYKPRYWWQIE